MKRIGSLLCALLLVSSAPAFAQSAAEVIERARAEARQFNEYKEALEDPDQSVRLAVFEAMLAQNSAPLRMMAIQTGIGSADAIMRSRALQAQIMSMEQLHLTLAVNPDAPSEIQESTRRHLQQNGGIMVVNLQKKDPKQGTFSGSGSIGGQISNLQVQLGNTFIKVNLALQDDNTLQGSYVTHDANNAIATLRLF